MVAVHVTLVQYTCPLSALLLLQFLSPESHTPAEPAAGAVEQHEALPPLCTVRAV